MYTRITGHALGAAVLVAMFMFSAAAPSPVASQSSDFVSMNDLESTIWYSDKPHNRVTVTHRGVVEIMAGKEIYVRFVRRVDDIFVTEFRWWNEAAGLNVLEHGVLTRIAPNTYSYVEADHIEPQSGGGSFPGIIGNGTFEVLSEGRAELIQVGYLVDGSASGFTTILKKVDRLPEVPVEQTYPPPPRAD